MGEDQTGPHDEGAGELGLPDPDVFELCNQLNAFQGVCTLQSCAGHKRMYREEEIISSGHLWIWHRELAAALFQQHAFELAQAGAIERVCTIYHESGQEISEITFQGNGHGRLQESMDAIFGFYSQLQSKVSVPL